MYLWNILGVAEVLPNEEVLNRLNTGFGLPRSWMKSLMNQLNFLFSSQRTEGQSDGFKRTFEAFTWTKTDNQLIKFSRRGLHWNDFLSNQDLRNFVSTDFNCSSMFCTATQFLLETTFCSNNLRGICEDELILREHRLPIAESSFRLLGPTRWLMEIYWSLLNACVQFFLCCLMRATSRWVGAQLCRTDHEEAFPREDGWWSEYGQQ